MAQAAIPVDLTNPGQVFACLGLLEAAETLLGDAEGGFEWTRPDKTIFRLRVNGEENPVTAVLGFLASAEPRRWAPVGYADPLPKKRKADDENEEADEFEESAGGVDLEWSESFPSSAGDRMSLPIRLGGNNRPVIEVGHWADGSAPPMASPARCSSACARSRARNRRSATSRQKASDSFGMTTRSG
jgi:CRISPR-associated protein Csx14